MSQRIPGRSGHSSQAGPPSRLDTEWQRRPEGPRVGQASPDQTAHSARRGDDAMRGMFVALMVMGAIWTGGLVWSLFGSLVLVPSSAVTAGGVRTAVAPPPAAPAKPAAAAAKPTPAPAAQGHDMSQHAVSHADQATGITQGNQPLQPKLVDGVKVFEMTASVVQWEVAPGEIVEAYAYNGTVPGPLLRVTEGDTIRIVLKNEL